MSDVIFLITVILLLIISFVSCIVLIKNNFRNKFDSELSGILVLDDSCPDAEIYLRDFISYIEINDIRCFEQIYIIVRTENNCIKDVCRKICEEYPLFEIVK